MRYLWALIFLALSSSSNGDVPSQSIASYDLTLDVSQTTHYKGVLVFTIKQVNNDAKPNEFVLDIGSNLKVTKCDYHTVNNEEKPCASLNRDGQKIEITLSNGASNAFPKKVTLTYNGQYAVEGLSYEEINGKRYYFATFANGGAANVLPCYKTDKKPFTLRISNSQQNENLHTNIHKLNTNNEVRLEDIVFLHGDFETTNNKLPNTIVGLSVVRNFHIDTKPTEIFSNEVLNKMKEFGLPEISEDKKLDMYLFPHSTLRDINGKYFTSHSLKHSIITENMGAFRERSALTNLIRRLSQHWFSVGATTDKWINVALSKFLSFYVLDKWPMKSTETKKFLALDQMVVDEMQLRAFETDGFASSSALKDLTTRTTVYDDDILSDPVLNSKGASIMRSLWAICGDENFNKGLKSYSQKQSSVTLKSFADHFNHCFENSKAEDYLKPWHESCGYPVVHVKTVNASAGTFSLKQDRFEWRSGKDKKTWPLFVTYKLSKGKTGNTWLSSKEAEQKDIGASDWIIFNYKQTGYYRVNYEINMWNTIVSQLEKNHTEIDEINRAQIIDDMFSFARSVKNYTQPVPDYNMAFRLFKYLGKEKDYIPLKAAFNAMEFLDAALEGSQDHAHFRELAKKVVEELYKSNPLNSVSKDDVRKNLMAREIGSWACKLNVEACVKMAQDIYNDKIKDDKTVIHPDIEDVVHCTIVSKNVSKWETLYQQFLNNDAKPDRALMYINSLGCTKNLDHVKKFINRAFESKKYMFEMISSLFNGHPGNVKAVLEYLNPNKKALTLNQMEAEKIVQMSLRKLNMAASEELSSFVKAVLPENNNMRREAESVVNVMKIWTNEKIEPLHEALKGGESRTKPLTLVVTLSVVIPVITYFSSY